MTRRVTWTPRTVEGNNGTMTAMKLEPRDLDKAVARVLERHKGLYLTPGQVRRIDQNVSPAATPPRTSPDRH